jgi:hypothetical protein
MSKMWWGPWCFDVDDTTGDLVLGRMGVQTAASYGAPTMGPDRTPKFARFTPGWGVRLSHPPRRCGICNDDPFPDERGHWYNGRWYCSKTHYDTARQQHKRAMDKLRRLQASDDHCPPL